PTYPTETAYPTETPYPTAEPTYPTETAYPTETPSVEPTGGEGYPTTSIITYTTCVPTVSYSTTVIYPTVVEPTGPGYTASEGLPYPTGGYPSNPTPPPYEGAASSIGANFAVAGLAAVAALFLA
ncbi:hypothetical protein AJ78_08593, partial [Emergomyces pasteurianus Ep9510]